MTQHKILAGIPFAIFSLLLIFVVNSGTFAATYYVSTSGNDSNSGTSDSPWRTIQKAADTMTAGDTVTVSAGTYAETVSETTSGSSGNPITYQTNGTVKVNRFFITGNHVTLDGFTIEGQTGLGWRGAVFVNSDYVRIQNFLIKDCNGSETAVLFYTSADYCTIDSCEFDGWSGNDTMAIQVLGTHNTVSNCIFHNFVGCDAIQFHGDYHTFTGNSFYDWSWPVSGTPHMDVLQSQNQPPEKPLARYALIEKNFMYWTIAIRTPSDSISFAMLNGIQNSIVKNNIIYAYVGIQIFGLGATDNDIYNNTFVGDLSWNHVGSPCAIIINANNTDIKNNIFQDQWYGTINLQSGTGNTADYSCKYKSDGSTPRGQGQQTHDVWMQDPKLVGGFSEAAGYKLQSDSPCINAGTTVSGVTDDYVGIRRPQGSGYDMGAYEYKPNISRPMGLTIVN